VPFDVRDTLGRAFRDFRILILKDCTQSRKCYWTRLGQFLGRSFSLFKFGTAELPDQFGNIIFLYCPTRAVLEVCKQARAVRSKVGCPQRLLV
jgi:hypothetical protein